MPVVKNPRKKVRKTTEKADTKVEKQIGTKGSKSGEGKTKETNIKSRKRKASPPDTETLTAVSHRSHNKVCQSFAVSRQANVTQQPYQLTCLTCRPLVTCLSLVTGTVVSLVLERM